MKVVFGETGHTGQLIEGESPLEFLIDVIEHPVDPRPVIIQDDCIGTTLHVLRVRNRGRVPPAPA